MTRAEIAAGETHFDNCAELGGPRHYSCAVRHLRALRTILEDTGDFLDDLASIAEDQGNDKTAGRIRAWATQLRKHADPNRS